MAERRPRATRQADTEQLEPQRRELEHLQRVAVSRFGMVATAHQSATRAGVEILERGGNAVDAAVAAAFALGVAEPAASGLGGQTMMMLHDAASRRTVALDGSSRAPHRATPGLLAAAERKRGYRSTTVPSTPAVLDYALTRYGSLPLKTVLGPAIDLAEAGCRITELQHALTRRERGDLRANTAASVFLKNGRTPWPVGYNLRQPALAATLARLARHGVRSFYRGRIARMIDADMKRHDGLIRRDDLAQIPWPIERRPLSGRLGNLRVLTFPPPGAGRTLIEMINVLSCFPEKRQDPDTERGAVLLAAIIRRAFRDRRDRPRDPDFYAQTEEKRMLSRDYAATVARRIRKQLKESRTASRSKKAGGTRAAATPGPGAGAASGAPGHGETTHLSVADRHGNVVALTQSIERVYGSCCLTEELGFLYNDYLSAFEYDDIGHPYYLRPNAIPWASVAPTLVFRGSKPWLAIGSPGSERITPSILQVLLRLRHFGPYEAVEAPRLHCSIAGVVSLEAARFADSVPAALERHGFQVRERDAYSFYLGCVQLVMRDSTGWIGVADPRRDGSAAGPRR